MTPKWLKVEEVIDALKRLGGEANWHDIRDKVAVNRGGIGIYAPYRNEMNYYTTMFQLVQQHCSGYKKFKGPAFFERVRDDRFRLLSEHLN